MSISASPLHPQPMRHTSGSLLSWPARREDRGAQARLGVPPEQTQPCTGQRKQRWVNISPCRIGLRNARSAPEASRSREGGAAQEVTAAVDVLGPSCFCGMGTLRPGVAGTCLGSQCGWQDRPSREPSAVFSMLLCHVSHAPPHPLASGRQRKAGGQALDSESGILTLLPVLPGSTVGLWDVIASLWASVSFLSKTSLLPANCHLCTSRVLGR